MSFFCDFLNDLDIKDLNNRIDVSLVFDVGIKIIGELKIDDMSEDRIVLKTNKKKIEVIGNNMKINSISKGEIEIVGKIAGVNKYE